MEPEFKDPPEEVLIRSRNVGARYIDFAIALRDHRERWAVLPVTPASDKSAQNLAQNIRRGVTKAFAPSGTYEAVADGTTVYVRFMGEPEDPQDPKSPASSTRGDDVGEDEDVVRSFAPKVREWARATGIEVPDKGRLPRLVIDAYLRDNPDEPRPSHLTRVV